MTTDKIDDSKLTIAEEVAAALNAKGIPVLPLDAGVSVEPGFNPAEPVAPFIRMIPRQALTPWPDQPRQVFAKAAQEELRQSMQQHGFDEAFPILARPLEYQVIDPGVTNSYVIQYRAHPTCPWRCVTEDFQFPSAASWRYLLTRGDKYQDVEQALAWLPQLQIVDGERRWTEAGELRIHNVPCVVRPMTDSEALVKALISALQKESLNPMEQGEAFARLLASDATNTKLSISLRLGITERHVRDHIEICSLRGTSAAKAIVEQQIGITHGRLLARLPTVELVEEWTKKVLSNPWGPSPMPRRMLEDKLKENVMIELRNCGFDTTDAELVPLIQDEETGKRLMGGACTDCPFNTRNMSDEVSTGTHMCMQPKCREAKQKASHARWCESAKPHVTLSLEDNDGLWAQSGEALEFHSKYVEIDEKPHDTDLKPTAVCSESWKKLVKGRKVETVAVRDRKGKTHVLVLKELAIAAAFENGHRCFKKEPATAAPTPDASASGIPSVDAAAKSVAKDSADAEARELKASEDEEADCVWQAQMDEFVRSLSSSPVMPQGLFLGLLDHFEEFYLDGLSLAAHRRGVEVADIRKTLIQGNELSAAALLIEILLNEDWWSNGHAVADEGMKHWAKVAGVDIKKAAKAARERLQAERAEAAKVQEVADGMVWKQRRANDGSGEEFRVDSNNQVENPERCELTFPKALTTTASVSTAMVNGEWVWGFFVQGPKYGTSGLCRADATKYGTRELALRAGLLEILLQMHKGEAAAEACTRVQSWIDGLSAPVPGAVEPKGKKKGKGAAK